jgi:hypothetical protein
MTRPALRASVRLLVLASAALVSSPLTSRASAQATAPSQPPATTGGDESLPVYLRDRGTGVPTSMFGTYVRRRELLVYPFFELYRDDDYEYKPEELGFPGDVDYRGRYQASEGLLFLGYGLTEHVALELEAAVISASLDKAPDDASPMPARIEESGLGDVEAQVRWRMRTEDAGRPEIFSYTEIVFPRNEDKPLIGTPGVELKFGAGVIKGFSWGTLTTRVGVEYAHASTSAWDLGEYAVEYLKRLSPSWRIYVGVEGEQDELSLITEAQWHIHRRAFIRFNNGLGVTSKATDWAPEIGIVFSVSRD